MSLLIGTFFSCTKPMEKVKLLERGEQLPVETGTDVRLVYTDSAVTRLILKAPTLERYNLEDDPYIEFKDGIDVEFYDTEGNVETTLTADYAIQYEKEGKMIAKKDVVVINSSGEQLNTEELIWERSGERIISDKFVKITTPEEVIYGDGLESNQDFTKYKIKNIKGVIKYNEEEEAASDSTNTEQP